MIRLLLVIPTLDRSGAEKQFTLLATSLPKSEFDVRVVALTRGGPYQAELEAAGIPVTVLHKRWKFDPFAMKKLRTFIKEFDPDIVHGWLFAANSYLRLLVGKQRKPGVIISERCVDTWKAGWQLWLDRRQVTRTDRLIGNSKAVTEFYGNLGYSEEQLQVIPNAVSAPPELSTQRQSELRQEWDVPADARLVGYAGRLARQKRPLDMIWSMQLLRQLHDNVYLIVIGDGPLREKARALAEQFRCLPQVRFIGHQPDAASLLPMLDVFWLHSEFEGQSNSLMEAMAAGVVPIVSDIPPNRELVIDGESGFLAPLGDSQAFSGFTDRVLADANLQQTLGTAARDRMQQQFSLEQMTNRHIELYRSVTADR